MHLHCREWLTIDRVMSAMIITATAAVMESTEELSVVALFSVVITDPVTVIVYRRRLSSISANKGTNISHFSK